MSSTFVQQKESKGNEPDIIGPFRVSDSEILEIGTKRSLFDEIFGAAMLICISGVFVILGGTLAMVGANLSSKAAGAFICLAAMFAGIRLLFRIPSRIAYFRDKDPRLVLSTDAFCDHRTGLMVELMDVESVSFERYTFKGQERQADMTILMLDGTEHVVDLRQLEMHSREIAWRVSSNAQIEPSKGVSRLEEKKYHPAAILIAIVFAIGVIWRAYCAAN